MRALIITRTNDNESVDRVARALDKRGAAPFRLDTDRFPTHARVVIRVDDGAVSATISDRGETIDTAEIAGAWHRRLEIGGLIPTTMDRSLRMPSIEESKRVLLGLVSCLPCFVIDPKEKLRPAENKQLQLEIARRVGLAVPRTLVTNDPAAVRAFYDECRGKVITKMMTGFAVVEKGREMVVFTNKLAEKELADLDGLSMCPMTFQEEIEKAREWRVTIVGERVFAAAVDSNRLERSRTDWRREGLALIGDWKPGPLSKDVERGLLALMDVLGLNYGGIDLIETPDGRLVFLEINPAGEFFWLERDSGLPISDAIADVMLGLAPRRTDAHPASPSRARQR